MTNREAREAIILMSAHLEATPEEDEALQLAIKALRDINDCRNELCLKCGKYQHAHEGACTDCRWR